MSAESETSLHEGPVHPGLHAAFAALDASECWWCILRLPEDLAHPTGDIDILVGARDRSRSRKALVSAGFAPVPHDGASDLFLSYSDADELWLWIDLATELSFGDPPLHVSEEAALLTRRERVDNLWVLAPEDRLWTLLLRAALDRDGSSERYRGPLHQASASGQRPSPVRHAVEALLPSEGDASLLAMAVADKDWGSVDGFLAKMAAGRRGLVGTHASGLRARAARGARRAGSARRHRGVSVALVGPDGVGKSTLAVGLAKSIPLPVKIVYMGVWRIPRVPAAFRGPGRVSYAAAVQWLRWLMGSYHRRRGRLVIFDRYSEEHIAPAPRADPIGRLLQRIRAMVALPAPDLVLLLETSGAVAFARKGEHSPAEIERLRDRFRALVDHYPRVVILDAEQSAVEVRRAALRSIWSLYRRRAGR